MATSKKILKQGDTGTEVVELAQLLGSIRVNGRVLHDGMVPVYDETMEYGVATLQTVLGLKADGIYGPVTREAWEHAPADLKQKLTAGLANDVVVTAHEPAASAKEVQAPASGYAPGLVGRVVNNTVGRIKEINMFGHQGPHAYAIAQQQAYIAAHGVSDEPMQSPHRTDAVITSHAGMRRHPITGKLQEHMGLDSVAEGDVLAPVGGFVVINRAGAGFGQNVTIYSDRNEKVILAHLKKNSIPPSLVDGARVEPGQRIGIQGSTGRSTGPHVHTEVHAAKSGQVIDGTEDFESRAVNPMTLFALQKAGRRWMLAAASRDSSIQMAANQPPEKPLAVTASLDAMMASPATADMLRQVDDHLRTVIADASQASGKYGFVSVSADEAVTSAPSQDARARPDGKGALK